MSTVLQKLRLGHKAGLILFTAALGFVAILSISLAELRSNLLEDRKVQTRHVVETAHGTLAHFHRIEKQGLLSRDEAQARAIEVIKALRYQGENYFWINDMHPRIVMHPHKPQLDGQDVSSVKDPNGKRLFVAMAEKVKSEGSGFVDYLWAKPGFDKPVPKVSYVEGFEPWGWVLGSGIYLDDVDATFSRAAFRLGGVALLILGVLFLTGLVILRSIIRPIRRTVDVLDEISQGEGDLTRRLEAEGRDETAELARAFNRFADKIHELVARARVSAGHVTRSSREIAEGNDNLSQRTEEQASSLEETASSMEEMTTTVRQNADNAREANQLAGTAQNQAEKGGEVVGQAVTAMDEITEASKRIAEIIGTIDEIAFQTNLLALNAAVEAARAGEQGRGFAVVAGEVRKLASRSAESAHDIKDLIEDSVGKIERGTGLVNESGETLGEIVNAVQRVNDIVSEIAAASHEQSTGIEQVNKAVTQMDEMTQQNAALVQQAAAASKSLQDRAGELDELMSGFKLADNQVSLGNKGGARSERSPGTGARATGDE